MKCLESSAGSKYALNKCRYIYETMTDYANGGNAYITSDYLYRLCKQRHKDLDIETFTANLSELFKNKLLTAEEGRIYLTETWRYEERAAEALAHIADLPVLPEAVVPSVMSVGQRTLSAEQRSAVQVALSHRLSMVLGGAGCGKSTLIRAIIQCADISALQLVLCAPTGKAARVLTAHTGYQARTVHSALGVRPDEDFLAPVRWGFIRLVIVDEASLLTIGMLAGILSRVPDDCRVVLLGDPNQLLSVGSGNVIPDLLDLGMPHIYLAQNHRMAAGAVGLVQNVRDFMMIHHPHEMTFDDSFCLDQYAHDEDVQKRLVAAAAACYLERDGVQVITPYRDKGPLSAAQLNEQIRAKVNPITHKKKILLAGKRIFVDGDRVMVRQNDREHNVSNGDVGVLHVLRTTKNDWKYSIELPDGRTPVWQGPAARAAIEDVELAYAMTVHKAQGSEYDLVLMPLTASMNGMLYRNLFYTAISRARECVHIYGSSQAIDVALQTAPRARLSKLVPKTRRRMTIVA